MSTSPSHTVFIGLGTNLGDRFANLRSAVDALAPHATVTARSRIYETPAWGVTDQPAFLNMVVRAETVLEPLALLRALKTLESELGRTTTFRWGPRVIDFDILFYDDMVRDFQGLTIPHPHLHERAFVLVPLADIASNLVHPVLHKSIAELLKTTDAGGIVPVDGGN